MSKPQLIENPEEIQLREQYEIQQIMGNPPGWILRWGITVVVFFFAIIAIVGWITEYADKVPATVVLVTKNPPLVVNAPKSGKITHILFEDKDSVMEGNLIAILENTAKLEDVEKLEAFLDELEAVDNPSKYFYDTSPEELVLGDLQQSTSVLLRKLRNFVFYFNRKPHARQVKALRAQIHSIDILLDQATDRLKVQEQEIEVADKNFKRHQKLFKKDTIVAEMEVEEKEAILLSLKKDLETLKMSIPEYYVEQDKLKGRIEELLYEDKDEINNFVIEIQNTTQDLRSEVDAWKQKFLIYASESGRLDRSGIWSENRFVNEGEPIFTIVTFEAQGVDTSTVSNDNEIIGRALMPIARSGKVDTGMVVNIHLDNFPSREFGILKGQVQSISLVPIDNSYEVQLRLENGLKTSYDNIIPFSQNMQGRADIITQKRRFWERIFDKILSLLKNN